ncbi:MAG: dihydropteroate synthase [Saprospiraceae bacterium]|nr:dihydropteroate synthase [Saprospiraceae bacterium]
MGILNITPDSFFDGGKYMSNTSILGKATKMLEEGAQIIDIGGMSSRPGADFISVQEELDRILPAVEIINKHYPETIISIDTIRSAVAKQAVSSGACIINDISAGKFDDELFQTVAQLKVPYILMHMQGQPKNMQTNPDYKDIALEVLDFMIEKVGQLRALGVKDICIDPGFGFGKSLQHNYQLLKKMHIFKILELPILCGLSRKSMIYKLLNTTPDKALNGTSALHMIALQEGAKILRVHDVREAFEVIQLWQNLEKV